MSEQTRIAAVHAAASIISNRGSLKGDAVEQLVECAKTIHDFLEPPIRAPAAKLPAAKPKPSTRGVRRQ
jgi:hypothetical protein